MIRAVKGGSEREFQKHLIREWEVAGNWAQNVHPSLGMKSGIPDVFFLVAKKLKPVELKIGAVFEVNSGPKLVISPIRPLQRSWAMKFKNHGGKSSNLVGVLVDNEWLYFGLSHAQFICGRKSFELKSVKRYDNALEAIHAC